MRFFGAALTDVGISKQTNQDSVCIKVANTESRGQIAMAVVCDGMGGLAKGELASSTVIRAFSNWFDNELPYFLAVSTWQQLSAEWVRIVKEQNYRILEYGRRNGVNLGTTLSALLMIDCEYMIAHVGDSRVYLIANYAEQLTEDQTFVAREVAMGRMTPEQAENDVRRNVLLQCVGASRTVEPQMIYGQIMPESVFMLCSDGLRHVLTNDELYAAFRPVELGDPNAIWQRCRYVIDVAKSRGERDNISAAAVKCVR